MTVAYLGFQKGGQIFAGHKCSHKRGAKPSFPIFLVCKKKFLANGGPWPNGPLNTHLIDDTYLKPFRRYYQLKNKMLFSGKRK